VVAVTSDFNTGRKEAIIAPQNNAVVPSGPALIPAVNLVRSNPSPGSNAVNIRPVSNVVTDSGEADTSFDSDSTVTSNVFVNATTDVPVVEDTSSTDTVLEYPGGDADSTNATLVESPTDVVSLDDFGNHNVSGSTVDTESVVAKRAPTGPVIIPAVNLVRSNPSPGSNAVKIGPVSNVVTDGGEGDSSSGSESDTSVTSNIFFNVTMDVPVEEAVNSTETVLEYPGGEVDNTDNATLVESPTDVVSLDDFGNHNSSNYNVTADDLLVAPVNDIQNKQVVAPVETSAPALNEAVSLSRNLISPGNAAVDNSNLSPDSSSAPQITGAVDMTRQIVGIGNAVVIEAQTATSSVSELPQPTFSYTAYPEGPANTLIVADSFVVTLDAFGLDSSPSASASSGDDNQLQNRDIAPTPTPKPVLDSAVELERAPVDAGGTVLVDEAVGLTRYLPTYVAPIANYLVTPTGTETASDGAIATEATETVPALYPGGDGVGSLIEPDGNVTSLDSFGL
jgi:hypothetical protein